MKLATTETLMDNKTEVLDGGGAGDRMTVRPWWERSSVTNLPQAAGRVPRVVAAAVGARDRTEPPVNWALSGGLSPSLGAKDEAMRVVLDT